MSNVVVTMKDGAKREFNHRGRPGGSYTVRTKYEGAFLVITDEYDKQTAIPAADIAEVVTTPSRYY